MLKEDFDEIEGQACGRCRWYAAESLEHGCCRHSPPQLVLADVDRIVSRFPMVANTSGCSKFEPGPLAAGVRRKRLSQAAAPIERSYLAR